MFFKPNIYKFKFFYKLNNRCNESLVARTCISGQLGDCALFVTKSGCHDYFEVPASEIRQAIWQFFFDLAKVHELFLNFVCIELGSNNRISLQLLANLKV